MKDWKNGKKNPGSVLIIRIKNPSLNRSLLINNGFIISRKKKRLTFWEWNAQFVNYYFP